MPMLSIIVAVHNVQGYLRQCLDSVLATPGSDIEVIAVDDHSPDHSPAILDEYAQRDPRLSVIHLATNVGLGLARNAGLDEATGEYVWFVDGDDWLAPGAVPAVLARLRETDPGPAAGGPHPGELARRTLRQRRARTAAGDPGTRLRHPRRRAPADHAAHGGLEQGAAARTSCAVPACGSTSAGTRTCRSPTRCWSAPTGSRPWAGSATTTAGAAGRASRRPAARASSRCSTSGPACSPRSTRSAPGATCSGSTSTSGWCGTCWSCRPSTTGCRPGRGGPSSTSFPASTAGTGRPACPPRPAGWTGSGTASSRATTTPRSGGCGTRGWCSELSTRDFCARGAAFAGPGGWAPAPSRRRSGSAVYHLYRLVPVDPRLAVYAAYWYRGVSCNPAAIHAKARRAGPGRARGLGGRRRPRRRPCRPECPMWWPDRWRTTGPWPGPGGWSTT